MLADMDPDDMWGVAVSRATKFPERAQKQSEQQVEVDGTPARSTLSGVTSSIAPCTSRGAKLSVTGEEKTLIEAVIDCEGSRKAMGEGKGLGETHSQQAVVELHRWLLQSDYSAKLPPPYDRETQIQNIPSPVVIPGVAETREGSKKRVPRHVWEQLESEEWFKRLSFTAIEPFPEEEREWDGEELSP